MNLVIIDYGSGNLRSVEYAFKNSVNTNKLDFRNLDNVPSTKGTLTGNK